MISDLLGQMEHVARSSPDLVDAPQVLLDEAVGPERRVERSVRVEPAEHPGVLVGAARHHAHGALVGHVLAPQHVATGLHRHMATAGLHQRGRVGRIAHQLVRQAVRVVQVVPLWPNLQEIPKILGATVETSANDPGTKVTIARAA